MRNQPLLPMEMSWHIRGKKGIHPPSLLDPRDQKVLENPTVVVPWQSWQPHMGQEGCPIRGTLGQHVGKMQPLDTKDKDLQAGLGIKSRENLRELTFSKNPMVFSSKKIRSLDKSWIQGLARPEGISVPCSPPLSGFFHSLRYLDPPSAQDNGEAAEMAF